MSNYFNYQDKSIGSTYYDIAEFTSAQNYTWCDDSWGSINSVNVITTNGILDSSGTFQNGIKFNKAGIYELLITINFYANATSGTGYQLFRLNKNSSSTVNCPYYYYTEAFGSSSTESVNYDIGGGNNYAVNRTPTVTCSESIDVNYIYTIYYNPATTTTVSGSGSGYKMYKTSNYFNAIVNVPTDGDEFYFLFHTISSITGYDTDGYITGTSCGSYLTDGTTTTGSKSRVVARLISTVASQP